MQLTRRPWTSRILDFLGNFFLVLVSNVVEANLKPIASKYVANSVKLQMYLKAGKNEKYSFADGG